MLGMASTAPLCLLEDAYSRVSLLRGLHVLAVRRLGEAEGKHFEGIQQAVKHRALQHRRLPSELARSLREVELAVVYQRHADACMVEKLVSDLEAALQGDGRPGLSAASARPSGSDGTQVQHESFYLGDGVDAAFRRSSMRKKQSRMIWRVC